MPPTTKSSPAKNSASHPSGSAKLSLGPPLRSPGHKTPLLDYPLDQQQYLSPGMVERKVNAKKVSKAGWSAVWAAHTEAWSDVEYEFVIGKTDPGVPKGMEHLSPRAPVVRRWKSTKILVKRAAEFLELFDFEGGGEEKTGTTQKTIQKITVPVQKIVQKSVPIQQKPVLTHKIIEIQQKSNPFQQKTAPVQKVIAAQKTDSFQQKTAPVQKVIAAQKTNSFQQNPVSVQKIITIEKPAPHKTITIEKPTTTSTKQKTTIPMQQTSTTTTKTAKPPATTTTIPKPITTKIANSAPTHPITATTPIPTAFLHSVLKDGTFIKWITSPDPTEYPLTETQAVEFKKVKDHP
ncbi:hypothetical protein TI39_contig4482g00001 [Zymoseptoria brevis]|uniref:Uncharacterized protein n=1 Tax=Zymoseptoria brevis TaxID=1047168 RepID=A0A0F4G6J3_9PEZI|nr:hypothetical protein TI39_contig4482g00001 [Zymoseptoria brevis]